MTNIKLISIPYLDKNYNNVIDFDSKDSKESFFNSKSYLEVSSNIKYDSNRTFIIVKKPIEEINNYDYLFYKDVTNKPYYYFIDSFEIVTTTNTKLYITLDVFTTYMFDFNILDSYVERCHVPRWNGDTPIHNTIDEGLPLSEYIQQDVEDLYKYNNGLLISSTSPLGKIEYLPPSVGGGNVSGSGWQDGKLSARGFRFIKGFEGYAPYEYQDSGGYFTIGYGVTLHGEPDIYNELKSQQPISEELAAKTMYDLTYKNYGLPILDSIKELGITEQCQFDALLDVAYNCGNGAITGSNSLTQAIALNPKDESTIRPIWENFKITSNGQVLPGLIARRKQECNMYFGQEFEVRAIVKINSSGDYDGTVTENNGDGWLPSSSEGSGVDSSGYKTFNNSFGNNWLCPVKDSTLTSPYGWRTHPISGERSFHKGVDLASTLDTPVVATDNGVVEFSGYNSQGFGNLVIIKHREKYKCYYAHLNTLNCSQGQNVKRGQVIGTMGTSGNSTGVHLHWEIRRISDSETTNLTPNLQKGDRV